MQSVAQSDGPKGGSWWVGLSRDEMSAAVRRELPRMNPGGSEAGVIDAINALRMAMWGTGIKRRQRREL
jgi:hypothetical protein